MRSSHKLCHLDETLHAGMSNFIRELLYVVSCFFQLVICIDSVFFLCISVAGNRAAIIENHVSDWSHTFNHIYNTYLYDLHSNMEVGKGQDNFNLLCLQYAYGAYPQFLGLFLYFRFIKSDQNIMMLNLCASLVLAYIVFIASVEETDNEV